MMDNIYWARGVGHTKALLEGAKNVKGVVIVAHTQQWADELASQCKDAIGIGLDNLQYLTGRQPPIVIDHLAIKTLLDERDVRANKLEAENERLKKGLGFFRSVIQSGEPWTHTCQAMYDILLAKE